MQSRAGRGLTAALVLAGAAAAAQPAEFVGRLTVALDDPAAHGLSAIEVMADGVGVVLVSDRGGWTTGRIVRDDAGRLAGLEVAPLQKLKGRGDLPLSPGSADAEGLALAPDGSLYVSFEKPARVLRYAAFGGSAQSLPSPDAFARMRRTSALEALAVDAQGRLYTLPEDTEGDAFPVYRYDPTQGWSQPFTLPRSPHYLPVGADFGPDGRLYLLERRVVGLVGLASQVRAFRIGPEGPDAGEVVLATAPHRHGNLEGLSVWQDASGALRLTLVADDNFRAYLPNEIVEYRLSAPKDLLTEGPAQP